MRSLIGDLAASEGPRIPAPGATSCSSPTGSSLAAPPRTSARCTGGTRPILSAPWGRSRYQVETVTTTTNPQVHFSTRGPGRLTLVTSGGGLSPAARQVVTGRLVSPVLPHAPPPAPERPALPTVDLAAIPLLVAALLAGALAWHARRWFVPLWGRLAGMLVVAPFVALAAYEAATVTIRLLPPTF